MDQHILLCHFFISFSNFALPNITNFFIHSPFFSRETGHIPSRLCYSRSIHSFPQAIRPDPVGILSTRTTRLSRMLWGVKAKTLFRRFCKQPPSAISCRYSALRIRVSAPRASLSFFAGNIGKAKCERTFLDTSIISKIIPVVQYTKTPFFQKAGFTCVT